jgi:hypothetical protein
MLLSNLCDFIVRGIAEAGSSQFVRNATRSCLVTQPQLEQRNVCVQHGWISASQKREASTIALRFRPGNLIRRRTQHLRIAQLETATELSHC